MPCWHFNWNFCRHFLALKMEFVDRSIDRGILGRDASFAQGKSHTALPF
jgi:hypothetical protein